MKADEVLTMGWKKLMAADPSLGLDAADTVRILSDAFPDCAGVALIDGELVGLELAHTIRPAHDEYWEGDDSTLGEFYRLVWGPSEGSGPVAQEEQ